MIYKIVSVMRENDNTSGSKYHHIVSKEVYERVLELIENGTRADVNK